MSRTRLPTDRSGVKPAQEESDELTTADRLLARARKLEEGAKVILHEAKVLREAAKKLEAAPGKKLSGAERSVPSDTSGLSTSTEQHMFNEQMELTTATKARRNLAISEAMSTDRLVKAARAKNMSLRGLARKMGISPGSLIDYRNGVRPIPKRHADWIERELGLPPTRAVWPRGVDE
jgi:hypothetical protein